MKGAALKPAVFNLPVFENDKEAEKKGASDEERAIYAMSQSQGWKIIGQFIETINSQVGEINKNAIASGASFEEIGRNSVVITLTQEIISKILNKVSDATEACEKNEQ